MIKCKKTPAKKCRFVAEEMHSLQAFTISFIFKESLSSPDVISVFRLDR